jgi:acetyl-CoA acetyltransferase family protein
VKSQEVKEVAGMKEVVMVDFVRTPFGRASKKKPGFFADTRSDDLGILAVEALMRRTNVDPASVDEILIGTPTQIGEQAGAARNIILAAGFPFEVTGLNVDRACGSSLTGACIGTLYIQTGIADIIIAGGIDSLSRFPIPAITPDTDILALAQEFGARGNPNPKAIARVDPTALMGPGLAAEYLADMFDISKEEIDQWALRSNLRAAAAQKAGKFKHEIIPMEGKLPDGTIGLVDYDQDVRPDSTIEKIRTLPPLYKADGKVNAASTSKESDGASAAMFMSKEKAKELALKPMATVRSIAWAGCDPQNMLYSAYPAAKKALERAGLSAKDVDLWETNEAYAVVPLALIKLFGIDPERMNVNGGACAIGHPVGASGIRMTGTLAHEMNRRGSRYGLASICGGMGQGTAMLVERESYWEGHCAFLS